MNNINELEQIKNKYFSIIATLFDKDNRKKITDKLTTISNDKSRGEVNLENIISDLGNPDFDFYDLYKKGAKKLVYKGLIIEEKKRDKYNYYGEAKDQIKIEIIDNIIKQISSSNQKNLINKLLFEEDFKNKNHIYLIVELLIFTMNNYFDSNYDTLFINDCGIIDYKINLLTKHGSLFQTVPVNDFIYGLFIDGLYTEKQFDKYLKKGSYQLFCEELDKIFNESNDMIAKNSIKKQLIVIGNMFYNKLFYLSYYGIINQELKNNLIKQFNLLFNKVLQAFEMTFYQDDFLKIEEAMNNSIARLNESNKECLS